MGYDVFEKLCEERGVKPIEVSRKTDSVMKRIYREALDDKKKEQNDKIAEYAKNLLN